jgi:hypothetical protein
MCVLLLELESKSMTMFTKLWSSAWSTCLVHNIHTLSCDKVLVVSSTLLSPTCNRRLPILELSNCVFVLNQNKTYFSFLMLCAHMVYSCIL